jgi:threonine aldolase
VALTQVFMRARVDNDNARLLANELAKSQHIIIQPKCVESNIVVFALAESANCTVDELLRELEVEKILMIPFRGGLRAVTHYDVDERACLRAGQIIVATLQRLADQAGVKGHAKAERSRGPYG